MTFEEIYKRYLNYSHEQRFEAVCASSDAVIGALEAAEFTQEEQFKFFNTLLGVFLASDGKVSNNEAVYYNSLFKTNYSIQELESAFLSCKNPELVEEMDRIIDGMNDELKAHVCVIGLGFLTCDGELTVEEQKLFQKIIG